MHKIFIVFNIIKYVIAKRCSVIEVTPSNVRKLHYNAYCIFVENPLEYGEDMCDDGRKQGNGFCGRGKCNIFGYNCDGGCKESGDSKPVGDCDEYHLSRNAFLSRYEYCYQDHVDIRNCHQHSLFTMGNSPSCNNIPLKCPRNCNDITLELDSLTRMCNLSGPFSAAVSLIPHVAVLGWVNSVGCPLAKYVLQKEKDRLC